MAEKRKRARGRGEKRKPFSFEEALARLEEIASTLEKGEASLEESIALAEEGAELSRLCEQRLAAAEGKIEQLVERMGELKLEPFETQSGEEQG